MSPNRLEAFSDGVIAIIITIMVLELKVPHDTSIGELLKLLPLLLSYVLSFVLVSIYWINHHYLIHLVDKVDRFILWTNLNLLFWISLTPFVTAYLGENHAAPLSVAFYGLVQTVCSISFLLLRSAIARHHQHQSELKILHGKKFRKNHIAWLLSALSIPLAFISVPLALLLVVAPAMMYFLPTKAEYESNR
jgi:uncharacterized membrane protein